MAIVQAAALPVQRPYVPPVSPPANDARPDPASDSTFSVPEDPRPDAPKAANDAGPSKPGPARAASDAGAPTSRVPGAKASASSKAPARASDAGRQDDAEALAATEPKDAQASGALALALLSSVTGGDGAGAGKPADEKTAKEVPTGADDKPIVPPATALLASLPAAAPVADASAPVAANAPAPPVADTAIRDAAAAGRPAAPATPVATGAAASPATSSETPASAVDAALPAAADAAITAAIAAAVPSGAGAKAAAPTGRTTAPGRAASGTSASPGEGVATVADEPPPHQTGRDASTAEGTASSARRSILQATGLTDERERPAVLTDGAVADSAGALVPPDEVPATPAAFGQAVAASADAKVGSAPQASVAASSQPGATGPSTVVSGVALSNVPVEIGMRSLSGSSHFEIRLDPVELGRIEVKLDIDRAGSVRAHLLVDRPETLAFLQRDSAHLQRAFEQAGLSATPDGVALSLRQGSADTGGNAGRGGTPDDGSAARQQGASRAPEPDSLDTATASLAARRYLWSRPSGVDVRI